MVACLAWWTWALICLAFLIVGASVGVFVLALFAATSIDDEL